jgi:hypothetical protein
MAINDADTNVPFPFGDKRIGLIKAGHTSGMMAKDPWTTTLFSWLRDVAKITRGLRELPYLETKDIDRMVGRAQTQWLSYPLDTVLEVDDPTSTPFLTNYMFLQDSMMTIYRHNLSPNAPMPLRIQSLKYCVAAGQNWGKLIQKFTFEGPELTNEQSARTHRFVTKVLPEFCLHLWRCQLLLFASGMYREAIPIVIASRAIAGYRPVNLELPRYAAGLIKFCTGKGSVLDHAVTGNWSPVDEEIIAFAVGDMHGMYRGRGFPHLWDRPHPRKRRRTSESESDDSMVSDMTTQQAQQQWNGDMRVEIWDDVLSLAKMRVTRESNSPSRGGTMTQSPPPSATRNHNSNRMAISNLI